MFDRTMVRGSMVAVSRICSGILILLGLVATEVHAQTLLTLASFSGSNGKGPWGGFLALSGSGQTAPFVLQMSYDADRFGDPTEEATLVADG
jgi:hypothetical protein